MLSTTEKLRALVPGVLVAMSIAPAAVYAGHDVGLLNANGVSDAADAAAYYQMIDPNGERTTQDNWKLVNGFNDSRNQVVTVLGHKNISDLGSIDEPGFYRRIEMVIDRRPGKVGNVAMTTFNFLGACCDPTGAVSIVNMEYSPGPDGDRITKFYIYCSESDPDGCTPGARKLGTIFDPHNNGANAAKFYVPNGCASCHGGGHDFTIGGGDIGAGFLAFDFNVFYYDGTAGQTRADNEAGVKKLNMGVLLTNPNDAVRALIRRLYGGRTLPRATQASAAMPSGWTGHEDLWNVVVQDCQGCHTLSEEDILSFRYWQTSARSIREVVFKENEMPNSFTAFRRFNDPLHPEHKNIVDAVLTSFGQ